MGILLQKSCGKGLPKGKSVNDCTSPIFPPSVGWAQLSLGLLPAWLGLLPAFLPLLEASGACCAAVGYLPHSVLLVSLSCPLELNALGASLGIDAASFEQAKAE